MSAAEALFADLRAAILTGELPVGTRLPSEAALAERHGVSRSVVREALRSCHALGLTQARTGAGSFVVKDSLGPDPVFANYAAHELLEVRPLVEVPAAGWAAARRTPEQAQELQDLLQRMRVEADPGEWARMDARFHALIATCARNRVLESMLAEIRSALTAQSQTLNLIPDRRSRSDDEHARVVEAVVAGRVEAATEAMRAHLGQVRQALSRLTG
ncbi:FadR/GntR family transcriptional regulator [Kineococcus gynurae]|uniref:FadR/GntR family transcriptional regulator n=1 Tax=Kineococcus gynurae TaxID=452979 RepID=A0ABV5LVS0_9ACTN